MKKYRVRIFKNKTERSSGPKVLDIEIECRAIRVVGDSILLVDSDDSAIAVFPCRDTVLTLMRDV